jgi:hypothetical protein
MTNTEFKVKPGDTVYCVSEDGEFSRPIEATVVECFKKHFFVRIMEDYYRVRQCVMNKDEWSIEYSHFPSRNVRTSALVLFSQDECDIFRQKNLLRSTFSEKGLGRLTAKQLGDIEKIITGEDNV